MTVHAGADHLAEHRLEGPLGQCGSQIRGLFKVIIPRESCIFRPEQAVILIRKRVHRDNVSQPRQDRDGLCNGVRERIRQRGPALRGTSLHVLDCLEQ